jgi:hypothetical protein
MDESKNQYPSNDDLADMTGLADSEVSNLKVAEDILGEALVPAVTAIRDLIAGSAEEPSRMRWEAIKFVVEFNFGPVKDGGKRAKDKDWTRALTLLGSDSSDTSG